MNRAIVLAAGCILLVACGAGCLDSEGATATMTLGEFSDDYVRSSDNDTMVMTDMLASLDPGDVLLLRDTITNMTYMTAAGYTQIGFASLPDTGFPVKGDVTGTLAPGDTVEMRLHVIAISYEEQLSSGTWTFRQEYFREGWNADNQTFVPVPREIIRRVGEGKAATMTMGELIADYDYSYDNATREISSLLVSLNEGDVVVVNDTLYSLTYNASGGYTAIDFETMKGYTFNIAGDITGSYQAGDRVTLTLHVIRVTTTKQMNNATWTIEEETFEEGWDDGEYVPIPQKYLNRV
ncbi:MAG: hypothetical protein R6U10_07915 [Thermoplasmatota archaeon]